MKDAMVSMTQGRRDFSRLVRGAFDQKENIIITKRRKPVAVIISYHAYHRMQRFEGYRQIMEVRKFFLKAGIKAKEVYTDSKMELEGRP
jgi:prevent-host-death family protein